MNHHHLWVMPLIGTFGLSLAFAGDVRITVAGTVDSLNEFGGLSGVSLGDPLVLSFEVQAPGNPTIPGSWVDYSIDTATFQIAAQAPLNFSLVGPVSLYLQDQPAGAGAVDGLGCLNATLTNQAVLYLGIGLEGNTFSGTELYQNFGTQNLTPASYWLSFGLTGPGFEAWSSTATLTIEPIALTDTFCAPALPNSTGLPVELSGAHIGTPGSGLHLEANAGPIGQFGYMLVGNAVQTSGILLDQGRLCLGTGPGNAIGRYNVAGTDRDSVGSFDGQGTWQNLVGTSALGSGLDVPGTLPFAGGPSLQAGETWHFQLWYRDVAGHSNLSNGLSVLF